jgi:hypothetical protein
MEEKGAVMSVMQWAMRNAVACFLSSTVIMSTVWAAAPPLPAAAIPRLPAPIDQGPRLRAIAQNVQDAVITRYPELVSGLDSQGSANVDLLIRVDGSVASIELVRGFTGSLRFYSSPGMQASQSALQGLTNIKAGTVARNGAQLSSSVTVRYTAMGQPVEGADTARAPQRVQQAVLEAPSRTDAAGQSAGIQPRHCLHE